MTKTTIVDAPSVPVSNGGSASVPVKLDTSALSKAIQSVIESNTPATSEQRINPAQFIFDAGRTMTEIYAVYDKLRMIGKHLNGKLVSDTLPPELQIDDITINFRTIENGKTSEPVSVALKHVKTVGDIAGLLSTELGAVIATLQSEVDRVLDIGARTKELCERSRKAWEEANKDKRIEETTPSLQAKPGSEFAASKTTLES